MSDASNIRAEKPAPASKPASPLYLLGSSPHIASPVNAKMLMGIVLVSLVPSAVFGIVLYGLPALLTIAVSIAAAEAAEFVFRKITKQSVRNGDLSALVTGLLLALTLPPGMPLWAAALGAVFAIVVAKEFFGGLGANVFNPALIGRAFLLMSFPAAMTTWTAPSITTDALSGATQGGITADAFSGATPMALIKAGGALESSGGYGELIKTLFIGTRAGSIGESSILAILIGLIILLVTKTIDWRAPFAMLFSVFVLSFLLGRDPLVAVMGGGVAFGAVFMATDYVSAPLSSMGKLIFGCGAGIITVLIRQWGAYPEGVTYGILIMNGVTPFLNRILPKKYGYIKPRKLKGGAK